MLQQLLVQLQYPYTANCHKCLAILFQIRLIDQFVRTRDTSNKHTAKLYMLHPHIVPSTLSIQKNNILNHTPPFHLLFVNQVRCSTCRELLGSKLLSVSSDLPNYQLLGRIFIDANKIRVRTLRQDVTAQLITRFNQQWEETDLDSIDLSQHKKINMSIDALEKRDNKIVVDHDYQDDKNKYNLQFNQKQQTNPRKSQGILKNNIKRQLNQINQVKYLKKQLQSENSQNKEIIKQIVSTIDFFNQVLTSLQKRVSHAQNTCFLLKNKIEAVVPLLRKKIQE